MVDLARRLAVARGDEPADLVVRGGRVLSVFTREWLETDLAIADGYVAGLGDYEGVEEIDAAGRFVVPGFIDAHMHLESPKLLPDEFARLVLPLGTTAVVADPHELANVLGTDGVHWLLDFCAELPLDVYFMASSSVPASRFESPRRALNEGDLQGLLRRRRVLGLAEMMNFPGVIAGEEGELTKLGLTGASHVDGHAPGVVGKQLNAYAAAGIRSDHEALTVEEGRERLRAGMWVLIREASMARNLHALLPLVEEFGTARLAFCTDDKDPDDIAENGHINGMVRDAVAAGIAPEDALVLASLNPALWHELDRLGALAPGYQADVLVLPDLESGLVPDQIVTESLVEEPSVRNGEAVADPERDLAKIGVIERHLGTGRTGLGFVSGFGLQRGALGSTVAHDAHNIVVVGMNDADMARAVQRLAKLGGGIVAVENGEVLAELPLPVGGLLSDLPLADVVERSRACTEAALQLGCRGATPFLTMSFLALSVIPSLKITDQGLVDVDRFELVPLEASDLDHLAG